MSAQNADAVVEVVAGFQHRNESLHRHHDIDKPTCSYCTLAARYALQALANAGYVVVKVAKNPNVNDELSHGDELRIEVQGAWDIGYRNVWRRPRTSGVGL